MKLSEAIRLGAMLKPQYFVGVPSTLGGSCALMAAGDAIGVNYMLVDVLPVWPILATRSVCPECNACNTVEFIIACCLNDKHRWTRERIADWVAAIEPQDTPAETTAQPAVSEAVHT